MSTMHEAKTMPGLSREQWERAKPILFNTEMVQSLLDWRKKATRRLVKPQPSGNEYGGEVALHILDSCKHYEVGDILYVRETWAKLFYVDPDGYTHYDQGMYYYAADGAPDITMVDEDGFELDDQRIRWHPSIHMPKEAARLFLRVTNVRVERLMDITEADAEAEGVNAMPLYIGGTKKFSFIEGFKRVWLETLRKKDWPLYGLTANPWVLVYEFERISKEEA